MAFSVRLPFTETGPLYTVPTLEVGVDRRWCSESEAPDVVVLIVTDCAEPYVPAGGLKVGVAATELAEATRKLRPFANLVGSTTLVAVTVTVVVVVTGLEGAVYTPTEEIEPMAGSIDHLTSELTGPFAILLNAELNCAFAEGRGSLAAVLNVAGIVPSETDST